MADDKFNYTYSAPSAEERKEINAIRAGYVQDAEQSGTESGKLARLRMLDKRVKNPPRIIAISFGIIGTLVFGLGLTLVLEWEQLVAGIVIAALGAIVCACAYPMHRFLHARAKARHGEEIVRLCSELLGHSDITKL